MPPSQMEPSQAGSSQGHAGCAVAPSLNFLLIVLVFALAGLALALGLVEGAPAILVFVFSGWLLSLCLHEFGHAFVAWIGGDWSIGQSGYLTLDPLRYVDPVNSILLPFLFTLLGGIGFPGGAVLINHGALRSRAWSSAVSAAGPATNVAFLLFLALAYQLTEAEPLQDALGALALLQGTAIVLNLLPVPGLDGYWILQPWLPRGLRDIGDGLAVHSGLVLTGLFLFSRAFGRALFRSGMAIATSVGFDRADIIGGFASIRLW